MEKKEFHCYLDVDERHPGLFGECILPRDDDGMGFALELDKLCGKYVRITIEEIPEPKGYSRRWAVSPQESRSS